MQIPPGAVTRNRLPGESVLADVLQRLVYALCLVDVLFLVVVVDHQEHAEAESTTVQITSGVLPRARNPGTSHSTRMASFMALEFFPWGKM